MKGDLKMKNKIILTSHPMRKCTIFPEGSPEIPAELFTVINEKPDFTGFPYPLPNAKKDYTIRAEGDGVIWYGSAKGVTKYDPNAEYDFDKVSYFAADRDLPDNNVKAILPAGRNAWVLTRSGAAFIEEVTLTGKQVSDILLKETLEIVDRRGMVSQRQLKKARDLSSKFPFAHSDNDGGFTACFCMGEIFRYAVLKREKGIDDPETIEAKKVAVKALESCLLLCHIHGRGDGFVARTYVTTTEETPDDGIFFKRNGDKAICVDTSAARGRNIVGYEINCSAPIPERLRHLLTDYGFTEDDIIYKADTSSDEITLQMLNFLFAHWYLTCDDKELDEIIKQTVKGIADHIIDHKFILADYSGESTTWAKWNEGYFMTEDGYVDGALNSAELLFYLKAVTEITGEEGRYLETYNYLINEKRYADLTEKHWDRAFQINFVEDVNLFESIMYGDHMLCSASFAGLGMLEKDPVLLEKYRRGYKAWWNTSIEREHNPGYDFLYLLGCPDEEINCDRAKEWFYRFNISRLASGVSLVGRHDIPVREYSPEYKQTSVLLPPDERFISKYDRDSLEYKNVDSGGMKYVESCYPFNFAYWLGRLYGFIEGE